MDISNPILYIESSDLKNYSIASSELSLIMVSMLSLFEYMTGYSSVSLQEVKLIAIVNWMFHESDTLTSFMISFKYGLTLLKYS